MKKSVDKVNQNPLSDHELLELIHAVTHQYRSSLFQAGRGGERDGEPGTTHMDHKVLFYFDRHPGATLSDLAQHSGRDKAQLTRLIKGLRERGLLDGAPDPADRRNTHLNLTDAGKAILSALREQGQHVGARALRTFSEADKEQLRELLQRISGNLDAGHD
ncbi:MAG: MarR family transcriptional regulator [Pseudomonadota bacterium]